MGMYDYLGGEQVKIFYKPIFEEKDWLNNKASTFHSGGALRSFGVRDKLPLKTLYYKYPLNFCIFDYRNSCDVFIIKKGKFKEIKKYYKLTTADLGESVFNNYGYELNVKCINDFKKIKDEFKACVETYNEGEKVLFPDGYINALMDNRDLAHEKDFELDELTKRTFGAFHDKWIKEERYIYEKQFGEFIACYMCLKSYRFDEICYWTNPMMRYLNCKEAIKDFINEYPNIVGEYLNWIDSSLMDSKTMDELIKDIFSEPTEEEIRRAQEKPLKRNH